MGCFLSHSEATSSWYMSSSLVLWCHHFTPDPFSEPRPDPSSPDPFCSSFSTASSLARTSLSSCTAASKSASMPSFGSMVPVRFAAAKSTCWSNHARASPSSKGNKPPSTCTAWPSSPAGTESRNSKADSRVEDGGVAPFPQQSFATLATRVLRHFIPVSSSASFRTFFLVELVRVIDARPAVGVGGGAAQRPKGTHVEQQLLQVGQLLQLGLHQGFNFA
mmetsp:Transcript_64776/g.127158  ORF Transcript_64776/g.127158 Transcript_64776/m.127158 type:complete len:220 (-) Transcript_64776:299-958(-)